MKKKWFILLSIVFCLFGSVMAQNYRVGDQEMFIMATGDMMPKGSSCFTDYELFIVKYTYAPSDNTHIGVFMPFPVVGEAFQYATGHIKQRYINTPTFKSAAFATFTPAQEGVFTIGNVFTYGNQKTNINFEGSYVGSFKDKEISDFIFMLGVRHRVSPTVSLIAEFISTQQLIANMEAEDIPGVVNLGVRLQFRKVSVDLGGMRPIWGSSSGLLLLPFLKVTLML